MILKFLALIGTIAKAVISIGNAIVIFTEKAERKERERLSRRQKSNNEAGEKGDVEHLEGDINSHANK